MRQIVLSMLLFLPLWLTACSLYQSPDRKRLTEQGRSVLLSGSSIRVSCHISASTSAWEQAEVHHHQDTNALVVQLDLVTPTHAALCKAHYPDQDTWALRWPQDQLAIQKYIEASLTYGQDRLEFILN